MKKFEITSEGRMKKFEITSEGSCYYGVKVLFDGWFCGYLQELSFTVSVRNVRNRIFMVVSSLIKNTDDHSKFENMISELKEQGYDVTVYFSDTKIVIPQTNE